MFFRRHIGNHSRLYSEVGIQRHRGFAHHWARHWKCSSPNCTSLPQAPDENHNFTWNNLEASHFQLINADQQSFFFFPLTWSITKHLFLLPRLLHHTDNHWFQLILIWNRWMYQNDSPYKCTTNQDRNISFKIPLSKLQHIFHIFCC